MRRDADGRRQPGDWKCMQADGRRVKSIMTGDPRGLEETVGTWSRQKPPEGKLQREQRLFCCNKKDYFVINNGYERPDSQGAATVGGKEAVKHQKRKELS